MSKQHARCLFHAITSDHVALLTCQMYLDRFKTSAIPIPTRLTDALLLGYIYRDHLARIKDALASAPLDPTRQACYLAAALMVKLGIDRASTQNYLPELQAFCGDLSPDFDQAMRKIGHVMGWGSQCHALKYLGRGSSMIEIVTRALYCTLRDLQGVPVTVDCKASTASPQSKQMILMRAWISVRSDEHPAIYPHPVIKLAQQLSALSDHLG